VRADGVTDCRFVTNSAVLQQGHELVRQWRPQSPPACTVQPFNRYTHHYRHRSRHRFRQQWQITCSTSVAECVPSISSPLYRSCAADLAPHMLCNPQKSPSHPQLQGLSSAAVCNTSPTWQISPRAGHSPAEHHQPCSIFEHRAADHTAEWVGAAIS